MKKRFALLFAVALVITLLAGANSFAEPAISNITVTFTEDTRTQKAFTWYTPLEIIQSDLQVATDAGFANPLVFTGYGGISTNDPLKRWHKAQATGLAPYSLYFFRVGDATRDLWGTTGTFSTSGDDDFSFIAITDSQSASKADADLAASTIHTARMVAPDASFILHSGDVVDKGTAEPLWTTLFESLQPALLNITIAPAAGNHESTANAFYEHFNLPAEYGAATASGSYYSFTYGNAHFVTLNTNERSSDYANFTPEQIEWLRDDITQARANGAQWFIVNSHKGYYTAGPYATARDMTGKTGNRTKVVPILEAIGVNLVFQGHDHVASVTKPLLNGNENDKGIVYVNTNSAGIKVYRQNNTLQQEYLDLFSYLPTQTPSRGRFQNFAVCHVSEHYLHTTLYEIDQQSDFKEAYVVNEFALER